MAPVERKRRLAPWGGCRFIFYRFPRRGSSRRGIFYQAVELLPILGAELSEPAKNCPRKFVFSGQHGVNQLCNLVVILDKHFALPGGEPSVVDAKFTTNRLNCLPRGSIRTAFYSADCGFCNSQASTEFLLRQPERTTNFFYALIHCFTILS